MEAISGAHGWREVEPDASMVTGRNVVLRPVLEQDYEFLRSAELSPDLIVRGRLGGQTPGLDEYQASVTHGVLAQFIVVRTPSNAPLGLVSAFNTNFASGFTHLGMWRFDDEPEGGLHFMEGVSLFVDYLFARWPFRKLYGESAEYNYGQFASGAAGLFNVEARLPEHIYFAGKYWEKIILAIYRHEWESRRQRVMQYVRPSRRPSPIKPVSSA